MVGGTLQVGFVDTTNKLFTQTLPTGDIFVFPKGLVHFHTMLMHKYLLQRLQHLGVQMLEPFQFPTLCSLLALTMLSWLNPSRPILPPLKLFRLVLLLPCLEDTFIKSTTLQYLLVLWYFVIIYIYIPCSVVFCDYIYIYIIFFWNNFPSCLKGYDYVSSSLLTLNAVLLSIMHQRYINFYAFRHCWIAICIQFFFFKFASL